jgi:hypothetical protein
MAGGGVNAVTAAHEFAHGDNAHGALDATASGLGIYGGLGAFFALPAAPIAGTAAAAMTLASSGDKRGAETGMFGKGEDGKNRGAFGKAWDMSKSAGEAADQYFDYSMMGAAAKGAATGGSALVLESGAAMDNALLGLEGMGASSGLFGKNAEGHERGAIEKTNAIGREAGSGLDHLLGLKEDSTAGKAVGTAAHIATDIALTPGAIVDDAVGGIVGGVKAIDHWMFGGAGEKKHEPGQGE